MAFVKLDCGMLDSTLWVDRSAREVFITALLMAEPVTLDEPAAQYEVQSLTETGWKAPPGNYGFVRAAGIGIIARARIDEAEGMEALKRLGNPEPDSRSPAFEGRRLVRIDGGYLVLNYAKYRDRDHTAAERQRRWRAKQRNAVTSQRNAVSSRVVTHVEVEADVEAEKKNILGASRPTRRKANGHDEEFKTQFSAFKAKYPKRSGDQRWRQAEKAVHARLAEGASWADILAGVDRYRAWCDLTGKVGTEHVKQAATFVGPEKCFLEPYDPPKPAITWRPDAEQ